MVITDAKYIKDEFVSEIQRFRCTIDGEDAVVPIDPQNRHYVEAMKQVDAGELTIADADE